MKQYNSYQEMVEDIGEQDGEFVWLYLSKVINDLLIENRGLDATIDKMSNRIHELEQDIQDIQNGDILGIIRLESGQDMGTVERVFGNNVTILKESWAPGLWCGMEGQFIEVVTPDGRQDCVVKVLEIDLMSRGIVVTKGTYINFGDTLRLV